MKKLLLSVAVLALLTSPAMAGDGDGRDHAKREHHGPKMDTDGDGVVSKSEFIAAQEKRFDEMDANNDGKIQKEEFKSAREKWKEKRKDMKEKRKEHRNKMQDAEE